MAEDEERIGEGYRSGHWAQMVVVMVLVITAFYFETKFVVAAAAICIFTAQQKAEARLFDLCIRLRRTNQLLSARIDADRIKAASDRGQSNTLD